jgi:predicted helicase
MAKKDYPISKTKKSDYIDTYIQNLNKLFISGKATEHSYRSDLQMLLSGLLPDCQITNEPKRIDCGAPDYIITRKEIPVGYIEAKDIGHDLNDKHLQEQFDRYKSALDNLIFTDYLVFRFFQGTVFTAEIRIGYIENGHIKSFPENYEQFLLLIKSFADRVTQSIKSPQKLAEMMASKAKMLANIIAGALKSDHENQADSSLKDQMAAFRKLLIHDIKEDEFADIYAQTIAYGMFAARYHDPTLENFSRQEAALLIPKSNPFLRKLFQYVAGYDIDDRIVWVVDELVSIFLASDVAEIMSNFGKNTKMEDPVIHFYETFLAAYNPALRKARGVWYTPQPVVNFIVRAVDDILKTEFGLPQGLADTSKVNIPSAQGGERVVHKVQILDPATGTGTFLAEIIRHIYKRFEGQQGIWSKYVSDHLIPRLNGFELLMASYAMAHLKLDILFAETGYQPVREQRFRIFLTNSLEEHHPDAGTLFATWLSNEANLASQIKRDTPVMVVLGNPPYSVSSSNKSDWIEQLTADYKKCLNERNIQPLSDDYIKFIRFGQYFIDKNGEGILAYISNNSFIDGLIHRQMRRHLLESFDKIYILDLHGNSKKKETAPDGAPDQNVFDIMQGVSINIFIKTGSKKKSQLAKVFHFDIQGKRELKYEALQNNSLKTIDWKRLEVKDPDFYFVKKDFAVFEDYSKGFSVKDFFQLSNTGFTTGRDHFVIDIDVNGLSNRIEMFYDYSYSENDIRHQLDLKDNRDWSMVEARKGTYNKSFIKEIIYRPFDRRYIYYDQQLIDFGREKVMQHFLIGENIGLITPRQTKETLGGFLTKNIAGHKSFSAYDRSFIFPLYLYPENIDQGELYESAKRTPNLNTEIIKQIEDKLGLSFTNEKETEEGTFAPIDILDYIYAVLHSPGYREKYKEFLKIDFPRVPYPKDAATFWQLASLGGEIRRLHLLESPKLEQFITQYPVDGDNVVENIKYKNSDVYINATQYFANVPPVAWEFYIGGYQPAQKWLKDRKGRELSYEDIFHYQKIIVALSETARLMNEIDKIEIE